MIAPNDPNWDRLKAQAILARDNPAQRLAMTDIFGDLAENAEYRRAFTSSLASLWSRGTEETIKAYLGDAP